jgi:hypothetical protein
MTERVDPYDLYADDEWDVDVRLGTLMPVGQRDRSASAESKREGGDQR